MYDVNVNESFLQIGVRTVSKNEMACMLKIPVGLQDMI
jgi:hypothetical protein